MRGFYDIRALSSMDAEIDYATWAEAVLAAAKTGGHEVAVTDCESVIDALAASHEATGHWVRHQDRNDFAAGLSWDDSRDAVRTLRDKAASAKRMF